MLEKGYTKRGASKKGFSSFTCLAYHQRRKRPFPSEGTGPKGKVSERGLLNSKHHFDGPITQRIMLTRKEEQGGTGGRSGVEKPPAEKGRSSLSISLGWILSRKGVRQGGIKGVSSKKFDA